MFRSNIKNFNKNLNILRFKNATELFDSWWSSRQPSLSIIFSPLTGILQAHPVHFHLLGSTGSYNGYKCNGIDGKAWTGPSPISVLLYDVDKGLNVVLEFNIHLPLTSQIKVRKKEMMMLPEPPITNQLPQSPTLAILQKIIFTKIHT